MFYYTNKNEMNVKKKVVENIRYYIKEQIRILNNQIWDNKYKINNLSKQQQILKRTKSKLDKLSREIS